MPICCCHKARGGACSGLRPRRPDYALGQAAAWNYDRQERKRTRCEALELGQDDLRRRPHGAQGGLDASPQGIAASRPRQEIQRRTDDPPRPRLAGESSTGHPGQARNAAAMRTHDVQEET